MSADQKMYLSEIEVIKESGGRIICSDPARLAREIRTYYDTGDLTSYCTEEKDRCFFDFSSLPKPLDRFEVYKDHTSYMTTRRFLQITGGAGATHTFRRIMREVEREFSIEKEPSHGGSYRAFLLFLRTALFWDRLGKIRDPSYGPLPLVVLNAPEEIRKIKDLPVKPDRKILFIN